MEYDNKEMEELLFPASGCIPDIVLEQLKVKVVPDWGCNRTDHIVISDPAQSFWKPPQNLTIVC